MPSIQREFCRSWAFGRGKQSTCDSHHSLSCVKDLLPLVDSDWKTEGMRGPWWSPQRSALQGHTEQGRKRVVWKNKQGLSSTLKLQAESTLQISTDPGYACNPTFPKSHILRKDQNVLEDKTLIHKAMEMYVTLLFSVFTTIIFYLP